MSGGMRGVDLSARHRAVQDAARFFEWDHLPAGLPREVSRKCASMALDMIMLLPDDTELTHGLRRLLEAKDCFVRAAIAARQGRPVNAREGGPT